MVGRTTAIGCYIQIDFISFMQMLQVPRQHAQGGGRVGGRLPPLRAASAWDTGHEAAAVHPQSMDRER